MVIELVKLVTIRGYYLSIYIYTHTHLILQTPDPLHEDPQSQTLRCTQLYVAGISKGS